MAVPLAMLTTILAIMEDEDEIDHEYYYEKEDGAISESDKMDEEVEDIEYKTK
jgi:hypothetical protein